MRIVLKEEEKKILSPTTKKLFPVSSFHHSRRRRRRRRRRRLWPGNKIFKGLLYFFRLKSWSPCFCVGNLAQKCKKLSRQVLSLSLQSLLLSTQDSTLGVK